MQQAILNERANVCLYECVRAHHRTQGFVFTRLWWALSSRACGGTHPHACRLLCTHTAGFHGDSDGGAAGNIVSFVCACVSAFVVVSNRIRDGGVVNLRVAPGGAESVLENVRPRCASLKFYAKMCPVPFPGRCRHPTGTLAPWSITARPTSSRLSAWGF
jgi:hypothetical protein